MKPNRFDKTVVIPVKWINGNFQYFHGGEMPKLREGTIGDLVVPIEAVDDKPFLARLSEASGFEEPQLRGTSVFAAVSSQQVPQSLREFAMRGDSVTPGVLSSVTAARFPDNLFVEIKLEEPLRLQLRGTKAGRVIPAKCWIPSLRTQARSLNHAYGLISEKFEPERMSHTGNVFDKILVLPLDAKEWVPLRDMRDEFESSNRAALGGQVSRENEEGLRADFT